MCLLSEPDTYTHYRPKMQLLGEIHSFVKHRTNYSNLRLLLVASDMSPSVITDIQNVWVYQTYAEPEDFPTRASLVSGLREIECPRTRFTNHRSRGLGCISLLQVDRGKNQRIA